ncbi:fluoride efflux transporter CrcB [bacterium]|nr:fluoride efflux transporter CrcB [bacterium]
MLLTRILVIGAGGFVGAIARHVLAGLVQHRAGFFFPTGTLAVNAIGCGLMGALLVVIETRQVLGPDARAFLAVGILGSFTTFSTFGYETMELLRVGSTRLAAVNIAANVVLGLAALWVGRTLARALVA